MAGKKRGPTPSYLARKARKRGDSDYLLDMLTDTEWPLE